MLFCRVLCDTRSERKKGKSLSPPHFFFGGFSLEVEFYEAAEEHGAFLQRKKSRINDFKIFPRSLKTSKFSKFSFIQMVLSASEIASKFFYYLKASLLTSYGVCLLFVCCARTLTKRIFTHTQNGNERWKVQILHRKINFQVCKLRPVFLEKHVSPTFFFVCSAESRARVEIPKKKEFRVLNPELRLKWVKFHD